MIRLMLRTITRWLTPGIHIKRWLALALVGLLATAIGMAYLLIPLLGSRLNNDITRNAALALLLGVLCLLISAYRLYYTLLAPYRYLQEGRIADLVYTHSRKQRGLKVVAIGGGTGLPSVLRAMKPYTANITAIVTVADDGGSSGRLRREMGVLPPGDLRNNIAALADDESLMTQLFQYRFQTGDLEGHAFGNLFIAALSGVAGGLENALVEIGRVLNIQGSVLPATLQDVHLLATVRQPGKGRPLKIQGESQIGDFGGQIESISLVPENPDAYPASVLAILDADVIVIGPGSLYTSILPNLLVKGITEALRETEAHKVYVCNVATQPGETEGYNVADHVEALERHIGRGVFGTVLANNAQPTANAGENTVYVQPVSDQHEIAHRYRMIYTDLTDPERPWRHDPQKLAMLILRLQGQKVSG
jgi:uncharacterized cofD-like protein